MFYYSNKSSPFLSQTLAGGNLRHHISVFTWLQIHLFFARHAVVLNKRHAKFQSTCARGTYGGSFTTQNGSNFVNKKLVNREIRKRKSESWLLSVQTDSYFLYSLDNGKYSTFRPLQLFWACCSWKSICINQP